MNSRALRYEAPRQAAIVNCARPVSTGRISIAETLATSISAGTEMGFYRGTAPQLDMKTDLNRLFQPSPRNIAYPMQSDEEGVWWMGYSAVGRIVEVGPEEESLAVGDLVWTQQGHKTLLSSDSFLKLPPEVNIEHATLIALLNITFNGMLDARVKLLDHVVIIGLGTLGQLLLQMCKRSGARVTAVDTLEPRLQLAKQLGADAIFNPTKDGDVGPFVQEATSGRGADVVFEVTGNVRALTDAIRCSGNDGVVTVLSFYQTGADSLQLGHEFHHKRITLRCSQIGGINPVFSAQYDDQRRLQQAVDLVTMLDLEPLISHRIAFQDLPQTLAMIDENPSACQAVVVTYP